MLDNRRMINHSMQGVFVFVLLGLFAVMSTLMVLLGAQMYRNTVDRATRNNEDRVLGAYVRSMVRAQDAADAVEIVDHDGIKTLALLDDGYVTMLYCYDGYLYEWYTSEGYDFNPASGTAICPALSFEPRQADGLLTVEMTDDRGEPETVQVALRCGR